MLERRLLITNASGVHGPNIAEHVLGLMLSFTRRFPRYLRAQLAGEWVPNEDIRTTGITELAGQTLGIAGLGRIGEALGLRARAFGMRIVATKRDLSNRYDSSFEVDALYPSESLSDLVAESDHVCIAMPYTRANHHLFDAELIGRMKATAYLYNISRGGLVDEEALVEALRNNRIAGAGLDVFETEPLPKDSPLWSMENVLITPHVAGLTPLYFKRAAALFAENLKRYLAGFPLKNLYDPERGY